MLRLGDGLLDHELCTLTFWHDIDAPTGGRADIKSLVLAEIVAALAAPFLVTLGKGFCGHFADALQC